MTTPAKSVVLSLVSTAKRTGFYNPAIRASKNLEKAGGNIPALREGVNQRDYILPKGPTLDANPKGIGFYNPNVPDSAVDNAWLNQRPDFLTRHVKIFWATNEKSQKVPAIPKENHWVLQFERQGLWKNPNMAWTFSNDTQSKRPIRFKTIEEAIEYCRKLGLGYEINYPRTRYHTRKNYGDNFKWLGNPKDEEGDL